MQPRQPIPEPLKRLATCQDGVLTLEQAEAHGVSRTVVRRLCDKEQWRRLGRGVVWTVASEPPWTGWA